MANKEQLAKYWELGWIAFPISLTWNAQRQKKELQAPKGWQNLDVEAAKALPPRTAIAIQTGSGSGIIVLDIDDVDGWQRFLEEKEREAPETATARSQRGGLHYYFDWTDSVADIKSTSSLLGGCADIRNKGGMIIAPPSSFHVPGESDPRSYVWIQSKSPWERELAEMPVWLVQALRESGGATATAGTAKCGAQQTHVQLDGPDAVNTPDAVKDFIMESFGILPTYVGTTKWLGDGLGYAVSTNVLDCYFKKAPHKSNRQFIFVSAGGDMSRRCHDGDCVDKKWGQRKVATDVMQAIQELFTSKAVVDPELVELACKEAADHVNDVAYGNDGMTMTLKPDSSGFEGALKKYFDRDRCILCGKGTLLSKTSRLGLVIACDNFGCPFKIPSKGTITVPTDKYANLGKYFFIVQQITNTTINNHIYGSSDADIPSLFLGDDIVVRSDPELNRLILHALGGSDSTMARLFARLYRGRVVYAGGKWYTFTQHRWREGDESQVTSIMDDPNNSEFTRSLYDARAAYSSSTMDDGVKDQKLKRIAATIISSESRHKQTDIATMCKKPTLLGENDFQFLDKLDANRMLLGFENGVYDLMTGSFRDGVSEDHVSMSVRYNYDTAKMSDAVKRAEITRFLETVFPDDGVRRYALIFLASTLEGYNKEHKFHFAYGKSGRNGKGILMKIMESTLGDYMTMVNSTLICGKSADANAATPQLTKMVRKRFVYMSEVEAGSRINEELFKRLSGGDKLVIRPLFKESREVDNMAKILM
ncbi:hypothetical protein HDU93_006188, partial [Gonapodya sp. JEL0774]